jgi:hypothetical protein
MPVDHNDERSAYSTLLLHTPWPEAGESGLLKQGSSAVEALSHIMQSENLPINPVRMVASSKLIF